jgi:hypothetical protein
MQGIGWTGTPVGPNGSRYSHPGDPVTGIGDLDTTAKDKRFMASFGPFDFLPGDSQQVIVKVAVGHGNSATASVAILRDVLNGVFEPPACGDVNGDYFVTFDDFNILYNFYFNLSPPTPGLVYNGDFNGNEVIDIGDLVYLIMYLNDQAELPCGGVGRDDGEGTNNKRPKYENAVEGPTDIK